MEMASDKHQYFLRSIFVHFLGFLTRSIAAAGFRVFVVAIPVENRRFSGREAFARFLCSKTNVCLTLTRLARKDKMETSEGLIESYFGGLA